MTFDGTIFYDAQGNPLGTGTDALANNPSITKADLNALITAYNNENGTSIPTL